MLPPLTALNDRDLEILDALRVERFREFFARELSLATLYLSGLNRTLVVSGGSEVEALLKVTTHLLTEAWSILAATSVQIYCCNKLIAHFETMNKSNWNKLGLKPLYGHPAMATAVIQEQEKSDSSARENGTIQESSLSTSDRAKIVRSMALADIAADLEADTSALQTFLEEHNATLIDFQGTLLVSESEAVAAYEHYSLIRAREKMQERFALSSTAAPVAKPHAKATKNTASSYVKPKKPTITWKQPFKTNRSYAKTIQNALNSLFPNDTTEQKQALADIVQQNDMGKAYLDKIIRAGAYKNRESARSNLLKASLELVKTDNAAGGEEEKVEAAV